MRAAWLSPIVAAASAFILFHATAGAGQTRDGAALTGRVSSAEEGPMEGVVVSARRAGATATVSVVSDAEGRYRFPAGRLEPGQYTLRIRAAGYDLDGRAAAEIAPQKTATLDLRLRKTKTLVPQLSNAEWIASVPGTVEQKASLLNCVGCHTLERPLTARYDADAFVEVLRRMAGYAQSSTPLQPQRKVSAPEAEGDPEKFRKQAEYLASIDLSGGAEWEFPLKTLPRPAGRATRVIITEYDLPRPTIEPHDVILDRQGAVWYTDFGEERLGKLDPKTGKVTEYAVPEQKPGFPLGSLDLEADKDGNLWFGMMFQGAVARLDRLSGKMQVFRLPAAQNNDAAQVNMVKPQRAAVDGKVWMDDIGLEGVHRVALTTGRFETFAVFKNLPKDSPLAGRPHAIYDIAPDAQNNLYFSVFDDRYIGRLDAKTGERSFYETPTDHSRPRRLRMDGEDRLWFAEYRGNRIGMLDTRSGIMQEWALPTPWTGPYDVALDKNGEAWTGGMTSDRVVRLDPKTGATVEYPLPRETNIRRVFVDDATAPVTLWIGNNHGASIIKLEPLD
ncbi:MAG TPA: carboxypeptidase regulatory-like domain-containing protein [Stellaceae bacterium]|nr:carboxypeptidase regulatory-like domain-containing protein [Stellaceae bacterium]